MLEEGFFLKRLYEHHITMMIDESPWKKLLKFQIDVLME